MAPSVSNIHAERADAALFLTGSIRLRAAPFFLYMGSSHMGNVTLSPSEVIAVIAGATGLVTAIWHAAMYVGKLTVRLGTHDDKLKIHESRLDDHDHELRFLKGIR